MTLASTIITRAFRQENLTAVGASPTADEQAEALYHLNNLIQELFGFELGEVVYDWQIPPTRTSATRTENPRDPYAERENVTIYTNPPANVRLVTKISSAQTVYLPEFPDDGARMTFADAGASATLTLDANGRTIEGAATLAIPVSSIKEYEWFYRADLANWVRVTTLTAGDSLPLPVKYDMLFQTGLAIRLSPGFGKEPRAVTVAMFEEARSKFSAQYRQEVLTPATYNLANLQSFRFPEGPTGHGAFSGA